MRRVATATAALVAVVVPAGCAEDRSGSAPGPVTAAPNAPATSARRPATTTTLPDLRASAGLAASIRQFREDEAVDRMQIELVRGTDDDVGDLVRVRSVRLRWAGLEVVGPTGHELAVAAGQRVDVPVPVGAAVCTTSERPAVEGGTVDVEVVGVDGTVTTVAAPLLADAATALDNIWTKGCVRQRLLDRVGLEWTGWARNDVGGIPTATGDLVVTRRATDDPVRVAGVDGSVLLVVAGGEAAPTMDPTATTVRVPVTVTGSGRCDGHALGDSKRTYVFQVQVAIGDGDPVGVDVSVAEADRPLLGRVIVDTCGDDHRR